MPGNTAEGTAEDSRAIPVEDVILLGTWNGRGGSLSIVHPLSPELASRGGRGLLGGRGFPGGCLRC